METKKDPKKKTTSWIDERIQDQNRWKKKRYEYSRLITSLLRLGGDFVYIAKEGDPMVELLSRKGKQFKCKITKIGREGNRPNKLLVIRHVKDDPTNNRLCIGYTQVINQSISFWIKNYWVYNIKTNTIIESTLEYPKRYWGIQLSTQGADRLINSVRS